MIPEGQEVGQIVMVIMRILSLQFVQKMLGNWTQVTFTEWNTQVNLDQLTIYNGSDISAPVLGVFSGAAANSPSFVTGHSRQCYRVLNFSMG